MAQRGAPRSGDRSSLAAIPAMTGSMLRRLQVEKTLMLTILAVVFVTSLVVTALPRLYNQMSDDGLVYDVENASTFGRNLNAVVNTRIPAGQSDTFAPVEQVGDDFLGDLPVSIQDVVVDSNWVFDSARHEVTDVPGAPVFGSDRFMRLRYQSEIEDHIRLLSGELPQIREAIPPPCIGDCPPADDLLPLFEVAISGETSEQISLQVGDQIIMTPDRTDPLHRGRDFTALNYSFVLEVSGIFEPVDASDPYWFDDTRLQRAAEFDDGLFITYYATSLIAPDAYESILDLNDTASIAFEFRYYVDPERFDLGTLPQLASDVRNAEFTYASTGSTFAPDQFMLRTGLSSLFNRFLSNQQQALSVLSLAGIGLLSVILAVVSLLAALTVERRRPTIALLRGRGASRGQMIAGQAIEGVLVAIPAVLLGYVVALLLVDARASIWSPVAAAGTVLAVTVILVAASLPYFRAPLREVEENTAGNRRTSTRRIIIELTIVVLAVAGVVLLRRRGISPEGATGEGAGFDPYLAAVPILIGLATGLAALRLYPIPVRLLAWLGSLRRDLVMFVGLRRVAGQAAAARLPLLVILLAVALAVFSSVIQTSIDQGQVETSWQNIGADYRIEPPLPGANLSSNVNVSGVAGVQAFTPAHIATTNQIISPTGRGSGSVRLMLIDPGEYQQVSEGTPADPQFPEVMLREQVITDIGSPANPIPAIVSTAWPAGSAPAPGETFVLSMRSLEITFVVREVRDRFHGLPASEPFIVAAHDSVADMNPRIPYRPNLLFVRGEPGIEDSLRATVSGQSQYARTLSREALYASVRDAPLTSGVQVGFRLAVVLATICASLAAVVALALTARARQRDLAYMRTLGLSTNQALLMTMVEQLPPVIVAGVAGSLLGAGTAMLVEPGVDLNAFTGAGLPASLLIEWTSISLVAGTLLGIVILAILAFGLASRSVNLGQILRVGDR
jgi:putative ABC transport system permease protein